MAANRPTFEVDADGNATSSELPTDRPADQIDGSVAASATSNGALSPAALWWGGEVVADWTDSLGLATVTFGGLDLNRGEVYACAVRVWNKAGGMAEAVSDGVVVEGGGLPCFGRVRVVEVQRRD